MNHIALFLSARIGEVRARVLARHARAMPYLGWAGLAVVACEVAFYGLGRYGFVNGNESLYVESAREMALSGNWAVPTLNGVPYLEKPPLFVWLLALSNAAAGGLGVSSPELAMRMVTALATLALAAVTARTSLLAGCGKGVAAGFILITTLGIDIMSRVAMPDLLLTLLFCGGVFSLLTGLLRGRRSDLRLCAGLLGVAALCKGPLPLALFALIAAAAFGWQPSWRPALRGFARDPWTAALLFGPMAMWLWAAERRLPGAAAYFIFNEQVARYLGTREPHDFYSGSMLYYVPRLFVFFFPWAGVLFCGWWQSLRSADPARAAARRYLWLCVWVPFAFFSLSSAKANYYVILCVPPMALLCADYLPLLLPEARRLSLFVAISSSVLIMALLWGVRVWLVAHGKTTPLLPSNDGSGPLTVIFVLVMTLVVLFMIHAGWRRAAAFCLGSLVVPISMQFDHIVERAAPYISARDMARYILENHPRSTVFLFEDFEALGALPIYLGRTLPVIDSRSSDLAFGQRIQPDHPNFVTARQVLAGRGEALVVVMNDRERDLRRSHLSGALEYVTEIGKARLYRVLPGRAPP